MSTQPENLSAYLDGELTAAEIAELEAELEADPELRAELEALESMVELVRSEGPRMAPEGFAAAVLAKVAEEPAPAGGTLVWLRRPMGIPLEALAVAAVALFVLIFALQGSEDDHGAAQREVSSPAEPVAKSAAAPAEEAEPEQWDDGVAMVAPAPVARPRPKARPQPAPASSKEALLLRGTETKDQDQVTTAEAEGTGEAAQTGADVLTSVPFNYTLVVDRPDVLKQLDRIARRHGGQLQTASGEPFRVGEMSPGTARIFVSIPNTEMSAFTTELRDLGDVSSTSTTSFFPGDRVRLQLDVDYEPGKTIYAPSARQKKSYDYEEAQPASEK